MKKTVDGSDSKLTESKDEEERQIIKLKEGIHSNKIFVMNENLKTTTERFYYFLSFTILTYSV